MKATETKRKKVLIIAHYFPPAGGVGSFRVMKYVKYLRKFGWEPAVITAKEEAYQWIDNNLERNIPPSICIYRLPICGARFINDPGIRWIPHVLRSVRSIIKKEKPAVVYLTGGPFYPLILGPIIKGCFDIPYVIELRDPWKLAERTYAIRRIKTRVGKFFSDILEPFIIRRACRVICGAEWICQKYTANYKNEASNKFVTITNGYDPEDFEHIEPVHFDEFTVVYTGKFRIRWGFRDPSAFFQAMKVLRDRGLSIRLIHVGITEPEVAILAQVTGVSDLVSFTGPKSYDESLAYAKGADLLLLIGIKHEQTQKMFDYIGCKRPILALAPSDGEIAGVVGKIPFARLIGNKDPEGIATAIEEIHQGKVEITDKLEFTRCYEREHLTEILAKVLDDTIAYR